MADTAQALMQLARTRALAPSMEKTTRSLSLAELSDLLQVPRKTIEYAIQTKALPAGTISGRKRLFTLTEVAEFRKHFNLVPQRPAGTAPSVVGVANFKGGVGKTSTAVHLGQYLALRGYRVLMVDLDAQASLTTLFGLLPDSDVPTEMTALPYFEGSVDSLAGSVRKTYWHGLDLIPANLALYNAEFALARRQNVEAGFRFYAVLKEGLETVGRDYDVIVLDTPPALGFVTTNAMYAANGLVIPITPAMMDFASAAQFFQLLAEHVDVINRHEGGEKRFRFVRLLVSKFEANNKVHETIEEWIRAGLRDRGDRQEHGALGGAADRAGAPDRLRDGCLHRRSPHAPARNEVPRRRQRGNREAHPPAVGPGAPPARDRRRWRRMSKRDDLGKGVLEDLAALRAKGSVASILPVRRIDPVPKTMAAEMSEGYIQTDRAAEGRAREWQGRSRARPEAASAPSAVANRHELSLDGKDKDLRPSSRRTSRARASSSPSACGRRRMAPEGVYEIVYGHRRHAACLALDAERAGGWKVLALLDAGRERDPHATCSRCTRRTRRGRTCRPTNRHRCSSSGSTRKIFESQTAIGEQIGVSRQLVSKYLKLLELPAEIIRAFGDPRALALRWIDELEPALAKDRAGVLARAKKLAADRSAAGAGAGAAAAPQPVRRPAKRKRTPAAESDTFRIGRETIYKLSRKGSRVAFRFGDAVPASVAREAIEQMQSHLRGWLKKHLPGAQEMSSAAAVV